MTYKQNNVRINGEIPIDIEQNTIFNIVTNSVTSSTHGFHKYPAKFIPNIPRWAILKYLDGQKGRLVFDPFCGSGTTLVEGLLAGQNVIGIDIDPLSCLIAKVKTTPIDLEKLEAITKWLLSELENTTRLGSFQPECASIDHWFTDDAINKLSLIRTLLDNIPKRFGQSQTNADIYDLLIVCFSSIIRRASNADNESQKTYVSHTKIKIPEETLQLFLKQLSYFKLRIAEFSNLFNRSLNAQVLCSSSTEDLKTKIEKNAVDLIITSPPYIKAIDYIYNQMVELFWIGDLFDMQTQTKQNSKKEHYVGTKHIPQRKYVEFTPFKTTLGIKELDTVLQTVYEADHKNGHKHSYIAYSYFYNMEKHFSEVGKCLNPGSHYVMVVGDCSISGVKFESPEFLTIIASRNGYKLINKWGYQIKNRYMRFDRKGRGGIIGVDWVLDFVKE